MKNSSGNNKDRGSIDIGNSKFRGGSTFQLPEGWVHSCIGEIVDRIVGGGTPSKDNSEYFAGEFPFMTVKDMKVNRPLDTVDKITYEAIENSSANVVDENTLIVSTRMGLGKIVSVSFPVAINQDLKALYLSPLVHQKFFEYQYRYLARYIQSLGTGTTVKGIRIEVLKAIEILLPPLNEQIRIANKLDSLLAKVDAAQARLEKIPALLKRFRQSVLAAATSGELTREWRQNQKNFNLENPIQEVQKSKLSWIIENNDHNEAQRIKKRVSSFSFENSVRALDIPGWMIAKLEDSVLMVVDCHNKTAPYVIEGIPLIRTTNIRDGKFSWIDLKYVDDPTYEYWSKRCKPAPGDLIFTREAPMGEVAIIPPEKTVCLGQRTMLFRPIEQHVSARYLQICLMDPVFRENSEKKSVGTGVQHYRVGDVSELEIPIPSTNEQNEIVRRVNCLFSLSDTIEKQYLEAKQCIDRLTQSILAKAFRGDLVPHNPKDEPASELLKRIKSDRIVATSKKSRKNSK